MAIQAGQNGRTSDFLQEPNGLENYGVKTNTDGKIHQEFSDGSALSLTAGGDISTGDIVGIDLFSSKVNIQKTEYETNVTDLRPNQWIEVAPNKVVVAEGQGSGDNYTIKFAVFSYINGVLNKESEGMTGSFAEADTSYIGFALVKVRDNVFAFIGGSDVYTYSLSGYTPTQESMSFLGAEFNYSGQAINMKDDYCIVSFQPTSNWNSVQILLVKWTSFNPFVVDGFTSLNRFTNVIRHDDDNFIAINATDGFQQFNILNDTITRDSSTAPPTTIDGINVNFTCLEKIEDNLYIIKDENECYLVDTTSTPTFSTVFSLDSSSQRFYFFRKIGSLTIFANSNEVAYLDHTGTTINSVEKRNLSFDLPGGQGYPLPFINGDILLLDGGGSSSFPLTWQTSAVVLYPLGVAQGDAVDGEKVNVLRKGIDNNQTNLSTGLRYTIDNAEFVENPSGEYIALSETQMIL